jgi:hypothetical protein
MLARHPFPGVYERVFGGHCYGSNPADSCLRNFRCIESEAARIPFSRAA